VQSAAQQEYAKRILDLLDFIPDFRAQPMEHATNGKTMFVRWIARGTGPQGPFEAVGVDRLIIVSDHSIFAEFAKYVGGFSWTVRRRTVWLKRRHFEYKQASLLYPRKRTFAAQ